MYGCPGNGYLERVDRYGKRPGYMAVQSEGVEDLSAQKMADNDAKIESEDRK